MEERIHILIARSLHNEATEAEQSELGQWLAADPANKQVMQEITDTWSSSGQVFSAMKKPDCKLAWARICERAGIQETKKTAKTIAFPAWLKLATAAAAVLVIGLFLLRPFAGTDNITVVAANENKQVTLPDNSHISLRKGSKLTYPKAFDKAERHIALEGEAFFEVTHNEKQPFIVDAQNAHVRVLGTSFDVRCSKKASFVTVVTGRVQFSAKDDASRSVILTPGEKGSLQDKHISKETANAANALYWETGELHFQDQPFSTVIKEIGEATQDSIILDEKMTPEKQQQIVSIHFNHQSTGQMLNELCMITQCSWTKQNNTYIITSK